MPAEKAGISIVICYSKACLLRSNSYEAADVKRLSLLYFSVAIISNIAEFHLDFHQTVVFANAVGAAE